MERHARHRECQGGHGRTSAHSRRHARDDAVIKRQPILTVDRHGTLTRPLASAGPRPPALDGVYGALAGGEEQHCASSMSREGLANVGDKIVRMLDPDRHANQ